MLHAGQVTVNGETLRDPSTKVSNTDEVLLENSLIDTPKDRYLMLNKPQGFVCSHKEPSHPSVLELIELPRPEQLVIAGRLDIDTTGLLLLSDDGKWCHRITSPRHKQAKVYHVLCAEPIEQNAVERFKRGIKLKGETRDTLPAELEIIGTHQAVVTLFEGRYHQVKRMFAALGNRVTELHRQSIGEIELDDSLFEGEFRELTETEKQSVFGV